MASSYSSRMREESQMMGAKVAKLLQFENSMTRLSRDVEKLMAISAQHGMKIKELIVSAANSVSQVEFMAAITTTRFQNLNVVNTMKSASDKPEIETVKPSAPVNAGNREEVDQLKAQVIQLENELFNQNFKNGMEVKRLENEVKVRQKEIYEVKNTIRLLENKLEKFAEAVEAGGISTNVRFTHPPTEPSTPMAGSVHTTPGGRKQSLFIFSDEMADVPQPGDHDRRFASTPGGTLLGDIPEGLPTEQGGDLATMAFPALAEQAEEAQPVLPMHPDSAQAAPESGSSSAASIAALTPPTSGQRRRSTLRAQRASMHPALLAMASTSTGSPAHTRETLAPAPTIALPTSVSTCASQPPPPASIIEQQITEEDVEEWSQYIFDQINNLLFVQKTAQHVSEDGVAAALKHFEDAEERRLREKIQLERLARSVDSITQTEELSSRARRASMRHDVRKASLMQVPRGASHPDPFAEEGEHTVDVMGALTDFQRRHNILPAEEVPDYVYHSERKKKHSLRRSIHKEQYKERAASLHVRVNGQQAVEDMVGYGQAMGEQTSDILDLHSGDVSVVLPPQPIPPFSAGIDTSSPRVDVHLFPLTPGSTRTSRSARLPSGFLPPPGSSFSQAQDAAAGGLGSIDSRPRLRGSVDFTLTATRKSIHTPSSSLRSSITSRPPTSKSRAASIAKPRPETGGIDSSEATLDPADTARGREGEGERDAGEEGRDAYHEEKREEEEDQDEEEQEEDEEEEEEEGRGQHSLHGGFLPSQIHLTHTLFPAQNHEVAPALPELHIEPLFLDDLSEASSSLLSPSPPPAQTFLKPSLGVQNVVEEAKDEILDSMDRKLIKLCDHLNVRFQFVESQYQRNNAYLHTVHTKVAAIQEYIQHYSSPAIQQLIELFNTLADRVGELEAIDQNLLAPVQEAMEKYQDDLREFRDNVDDLMQFKVREAVLQVAASEQAMQRAGQETAAGAKKDKSPIALEGQEVEERAAKYARSIFYPDPNEHEVSLYDAERMQRQLRHYANLFEDLYGQHGSLLQRIHRLEEGPVYLSHTSRRRAHLASHPSPRQDMGEAPASTRPSSRPGTAGKIAFSDDLPPTPAASDRSRSPAHPPHHRETDSDMKQLREEVDFLKALLQVRLDPGWLPGKADPSPSTTRRAKSIPSPSPSPSKAAAGMEARQTASRAAVVPTSSTKGGPSASAAAVPPVGEGDTADGSEPLAELVLPHLRATTPSDQRAGRAASSPSTRLATHAAASKSLSGSLHPGTGVHPARPTVPRPNPLLMASPRKVVLSLDGSDAHMEGDAGHKRPPLSQAATGSAVSRPSESFAAVMEARRLHLQFVPMTTARDPLAASHKDVERKKVWQRGSPAGTPQPQIDSRPESPTSDVVRQ